MTFNELTECPFCGNDEFYTKDYVYGASIYHQRFDGGEDVDNTEMYSSLMHKPGAKCYCNNCESYLGNRFTGQLSKAVLKIVDAVSVHK